MPAIIVAEGAYSVRGDTWKELRKVGCEWKAESRGNGSKTITSNASIGI